VTVRRKHYLATATLMAVIMTAVLPTARAQSDIDLVAATSDGTALNLTIPIFDPGIPDDPSVFRDLQVFPRIREIEAKLMPFLLRETLVDSQQWGAVRVTTKPDAAAELQLLGTIVRSDGHRLDLRIRAVDATGIIWFDNIFSGEANEEPSAIPGDKGTPEFKEIYAAIGAELAVIRDRIGDEGVSNIKGISQMRYARELAPTAFNGYVEQNDDGTFRLLRLPARNDPMLIRIETIRNTEFLITDTVDAKFREFNSDLARTYRVWREYRRKVGGYEAWNVKFAEAVPDGAESNSWESIKHRYDAYKYDRVTAQEQDRLAVAFNAEVAPTIAAMEERVAELTGWVERESVVWHRLLEGLYEVETYLLEHGE
jgi:hypothetical protein